ncbi:MAG: BspA family leucine-rich repeat surface protein [Bacteroides sp.]
MKQILRVVTAAVLVALLSWGSGFAQGGAERPFITKWQFEANKEVTIPIFGNGYKLVITDPKGIETKVESQTGDYTFTPEVTGEYTVKAGPEGVTSMDMSKTSFEVVEALKEVVKFGTVKWTTMNCFFYACENMTFADEIDLPDLTNVPDMSYMFFGCAAFNQPLNNWNVSNVTNMSYMFHKCAAFNQPLNNWNVSNVTNMSNMFSGCRAFNQPLNNWNVSQVTNMSSMFSSCAAFNQPLNNWDVGNVTDMSGMFSGCAAFNQPLNNWDVSKVTDMSTLFYECSAFNQPLNNWTVSSVTNIGYMFYQSTAFNQPLNSWDVGNVTYMSNMFSGCSAFNQPLNSWDVGKVTDMSSMFSGCAAFNQPLNDWNVSQVTDMREMFSGCIAFNQPLGNWKLKTGIGGLEETAMSTANYSQSLIGWAAATEIRDISLYVNNLTYNDEGKVARATLTGRGWTFNGDRHESKGVKVNAKSLFLAVNEERKIAIEKWGVAEGATVKVTVEGTNPDAIEIVKAYDGKTITIKGKQEGNFDLKAKIESESLENACSGKVKVVAVTALHVTPWTKKFICGESGASFPLLIDVQPANASEKKVTITNSDPSVATYDEATGKVTAATDKTGKTTITVTMAATGSTIPPVSCVVEVVPPVYAVGLETNTEEGELSIEGKDAAALKAVEKGTTLKVLVAPKEGYKLTSLKAVGASGNETDLFALSDYTFTVNENTTVKATFEKRKLKVTVTKEGGNEGCTFEVEGSANLGAVEYSTKLQIKTTAATGYRFKELKSDDVAIEGNKFEVKSEKEAIEVKVVFELKKFDITTEVVAGKEEGCSIKVNGQESLTGVDYGMTVTVTETHAKGWKLQSLTVDGVDITASKTFVVEKTVSVKAVFKKKENNGGGNNGGGSGQPQKPGTAVEDAVLASLAVAPNPFTTQLRIENPEGVAARYELVNAAGLVVRAGAFSATEMIVDTEALPAGLYFVRIEAQNGVRKVVRVIKH